MPRPLYFKFQIRTNAARWLRRATSHCQPSEINVQSRALGLQGGLRPNGVHNFRWWNGNILRRCEPRWATPLRIYRRVFTKFLEVPSPPGKGGKVAGVRMSRDRTHSGSHRQLPRSVQAEPSGRNQSLQTWQNRSGPVSGFFKCRERNREWREATAPQCDRLAGQIDAASDEKVRCVFSL